MDDLTLTHLEKGGAGSQNPLDIHTTPGEIPLMNKRFLLSACALLTTGLLMAGAAAGATRASWPSLKSQLEKDRVPAGSPLAKLIAGNQDFQILRAEEARDKIAVPLWLRVLWRKDHPNMAYVPGDGSGGYPLVLKEVYEWMRSHPNLRPGEDGDGALEKALEEKKKPRGPVAVPGANLRISGAQISPRSESDIRVNYWNPSLIVGGSNNIQGRGTLAMFYSSDGGASWKQSVTPREVSESFQSDPAVDWTSDGTAWATAISISTAGPRFQLFLKAFKSTDNGATWKLDGLISGADQQQADKQMMWVDHSERSPYKDTIHVIWHDGYDVYVSHRSPGSGSWSDPLRISGGETTGTGIGSDIKTDGLGRVYAYWPDTGSRKIYFSRSTDGGQSFSRPAAIGSTSQSFQSIIPAQSDRGVLVYVTSGAFINGKNTNLYAAWSDLSGATGCRTPFDDPLDNVNSTCKTRIWFTRSTNGGTKWAKPRMLNNQSSRNDQFNPWLAVDETSGVIGLMYYDTVGEGRTKVNVFFQMSTNSGSSFNAPVRVSAAPSDGADSVDANQFGDYNALSGIAGTFFPSWTDRRDGGDEEIWTAPITIRASASACRTVNLFTDSVGTGVANVVVPEGATQTQLAFSHRRHFVSGLNGGSLRVSIDGGSPVSVPDSAILAGALFAKGRDLSPVNTVVDLDAVCRAATGADCGGRSLRLLFSAGAASSAKDVWFLDDAAVTSCAP
jgi:hypothetical protein